MLPNDVLEKIDQLSKNNNAIINSARNISNKYRNESGNNKVLVKTEVDSQAYSVYRMSATYEVNCSVFKQLSSVLSINKYETLLDVGSGTGSALLGCVNYFSFNQIYAYERESSMINTAKYLLSDYVGKYNIVWQQKNLLEIDAINKFDMIIASYVFNEFDEDNRLSIIKKLWDITNEILVIIEPGTPEGFRQIKKIRELLLASGGYVVAPCTHSKECPLPPNDWCGFSCRVQRTKMLKQIKGAEAPYEDEKYCYIAISKNQYNLPQNRILKHPYYRPKVVELEICNENGIKSLTITKSKKDMYRIARDAEAGDVIEID